MSLLKLTIEGTSAEELLSNLIAAANAMSTGAGLALTANAAQQPVETKEVAEEKEETMPTGRRGARRGAENKSGADAAQEPTGRRGRGAAKEDALVNDNEEQAEVRAEVMKKLQVLADHEAMHGKVQEAIQRTGAKTVAEIPSDAIGDFDVAIEKLLAEVPEDDAGSEEADLEVLAKLRTDLTDLADVIANPEKDGEDKDVADTLAGAWKDAGVAVKAKRGSDDLAKMLANTDIKLVDSLTGDNVDGVKEVVDELIAKYF